MTLQQTEASASVMRRISKLLALADGARNSSEAEASAAAAKVQELLQEYGLSLAEVEAAGGKADDGGRVNTEVDGFAASYAWQVNLMKAIAEGNLCLYRVSVKTDGRGRRAKRHQLVGRGVGVDGSRLVYDYLVEAMNRLAFEAGYPTTGNAATRRTWFEGCSDRLVKRLMEKAEAARRESAAKASAAACGGGGRALALSDVYGSEADLNNDFLNGFPAGATAQRRRENDARNAAVHAERVRLMAEGVESIEAYYRACGYGEEQARTWAQAYNKSSGRRSSGRGYRSHGHTQSDRRAARQDSAAYRSGAAAGAAIGLDPQATRRDTKRIEG